MTPRKHQECCYKAQSGWWRHACYWSTSGTLLIDRNYIRSHRLGPHLTSTVSQEQWVWRVIHAQWSTRVKKKKDRQRCWRPGVTTSQWAQKYARAEVTNACDKLLNTTTGKWLNWFRSVFFFSSGFRSLVCFISERADQFRLFSSPCEMTLLPSNGPAASDVRQKLRPWGPPLRNFLLFVKFVHADWDKSFSCNHSESRNTS